MYQYVCACLDKPDQHLYMYLVVVASALSPTRTQTQSVSCAAMSDQMALGKEMSPSLPIAALSSLSMLLGQEGISVSTKI